MRTEPPPVGADATTRELVNPEYWLVFGLEWPGDTGSGASGVAEAAVVVAPGLIPRDAVSRDAYQVLGCADLYARKHRERVVLFTDLTRMFTSAGTSWAQLGVDWEAALRELHDGSFPAMYLTITERAHLLICDPAVSLGMARPGGWADDGGAEREIVRQAIASQLTADWPPWMNAMIQAGRIRQTG